MTETLVSKKANPQRLTFHNFKNFNSSKAQQPLTDISYMPMAPMLSKPSLD